MSRLEELAFMTIYRSVVDCLLQTPVQRKRTASNTLISSVEDEGLIRFARQELELKLSTVTNQYNKDIRIRLLKHYGQEKEGQKPRLSSFLDVVLDESVDEISATFDQDSIFDEQVLPAIVNRSPGVQSLHLHCSERVLPVWQEAVTNSISQLKCLTSLDIHKLPVHCKAVLSCLGESCPRLKYLRIGLLNNTLSTSELLGIFYAGNLDDLEAMVPYVTSSDTLKAYHYCQVASRLLHPFCRTLEEVRIDHFDGDDDPYVIGFLLRHLPRLRQLETSNFEFKDYSASIRALWDIWDPSLSPETVRFLQPHLIFPTGSTKLSVFDSHPDLIALTHFTGKLSLTSLFLEGEKEFLTLSAICDLCPELIKLEILETCVRSADKSVEHIPYTHADIQTNFTQLNKLRAFTCTESDGPLCATITHTVAPFLTTLEMALDGVFIPKFDFLLECVHLKVLKLSTEFHPPLKSYFTRSDIISPESFLPKLEEVQLEFCMNAELEELFLKKSTLKHVDVLCLHYLGQTEQQMLDLFLQWPQLVSFKYKMPRKFTVDMGIKLLTHLPNLRSLSLYKDIKYRCSAEFPHLKKFCRQRDVKLELHLFLDTYLCIEGDKNDEWISTSDESETES